MKAWLLSALGYIFLTTASLAQLSGGLMFPGPGTAHSAGGGFSLTAQGSAGSASTGVTSINYGTVSGGLGCNADIIGVFWYNSATTDTITSLTYNGVSASHVGTKQTGANNGGQSTDFWQLNTAQTTGAIVVNFSANVTYNSNVVVYCLVSGNTTLQNSNGAGFSCNNVSPVSAAVTVPAGGTAIALAAMASGSVTTFTNATSDGTYTGGGTFDIWGHTTATGSVTVTATPTGSDDCALNLVAYGP
jgi:hypothetical protein